MRALRDINGLEIKRCAHYRFKQAQNARWCPLSEVRAPPQQPPSRTSETGGTGALHVLARLPKKSLTLAKKPAASGWVAPEDNFSNSASNSCCFLVRFCGVSTMTWTYMSPV